MKFEKKYLVLLSLIFASIYFGCSSGEYELEEHKIDYVEKTLKYDTLKRIDTNKVVDKDKDKDKNNTVKDSYSYIVQIGAFVVKSNFDRFLERAKQQLGQDVNYEFTNNLYKIRVGTYTNKSEALKLLDAVKSKGYGDAFILTVKNK